MTGTDTATELPRFTFPEDFVKSTEEATGSSNEKLLRLIRHLASLGDFFLVRSLLLDSRDYYDKLHRDLDSPHNHQELGDHKLNTELREQFTEKTKQFQELSDLWTSYYAEMGRTHTLSGFV